MVSLSICLSLSATVILLCLFAPKLYIVLFNPSKNIHVKFKTTLSTASASIERPSTSNNLDESGSAANNRRRQNQSADYTTEVSLYTSKSDSSALILSDEAIQTSGVISTSTVLNGACTDAERQHQQHPFTHDDETTDFLSTSKQHGSHTHQHKSATSNLVTAAENPWKKLSSVRYKLDEHDGTDTNLQHVHAQHITFV